MSIVIKGMFQFFMRWSKHKIIKITKLNNFIIRSIKCRVYVTLNEIYDSKDKLNDNKMVNFKKKTKYGDYWKFSERMNTTWGLDLEDSLLEIHDYSSISFVSYLC